MPIGLTKPQRQLAHHVLLFDRPLSAEVAEAVQRATLACAENGLTSTGMIEFFCGLHLQFKEELQTHFREDVGALVERIFPKHRFGDKGLVTEKVLENAATDEDSSFGYSVVLSDSLIRLLWTATRLAGAVGRKTSLKDVIAAITLDDDWVGELQRNGVSPRGRVRDFRDVLSVVFFATLHAHGSWPKKMEFDVDERIQPPFAALVKTPSGGFAAMKTATMKLNGVLVAEISWPDRSEVTAPVELQRKNTLEFEFDGPQFGSMEVTIRAVSQKKPVD
ncbi:MAG: hypothetical protein ACLPVW_03300 [Terriglobales bacterium]